MTVRGFTRPFLYDLAHQGGDADAALDRLVETDVDLGHEPDGQPRPQLRPDVPSGAVQTFHGAPLRRIIPEHADKDLGVPQVVADHHVGDRYKPDAGVL